MKVTEALGTLEGAEEIFEKINKPENKDIYDALYTPDKYNNSGVIQVVTDLTPEGSLLNLLCRNLMYSYRTLDGYFASIESSPLSEMIISRMTDKLEKIAAKDSNHSCSQVQKEEVDETEEYEEYISREELYREQEQQRQYVFAQEFIS